MKLTLINKYSKINFTKSPGTGAGDVSEPRLMSQMGKMHAVVGA